MATHRLPIMGAMTMPDTTGETFMDLLSNQITLTNAKENLVMTMKDPSADTGFSGSFQVPQNYVGTANIVVVGVIDGTVSTTSIDWQFSYNSLADNEASDAAFTETVSFDTGNTNAYTTEDILEDSTALTDGNFATGDQVLYLFVRDQSVDDFVGDFHVLGLFFEYNDS